MVENKGMQSHAARLETFTTAHQLSKRRISSQSKKKGANTIEWPHEKPSGEDLARSGFFYRPSPDSNDNVQCFLCAVKLDGWEAEDDALKEHLAHSVNCHFAIALSAGLLAKNHANAAADPLEESLVEARRGTFETESGSGWPHEDKKGWKCKKTKMVEAGWCFDPTPASEDEDVDGVTCFYCDLSLDGWEPKDDPMAEHKRRSPGCAFFALVERFGGFKRKGAAKGRQSKTARASGMSTMSEMTDLTDAGHDSTAMDDSIMSTASTATGKGKKKGTRAKAAPKGKKKADVQESQIKPESLYPDLSQAATQEDSVEVTQPAPAPAKKGRKPTRQSKQPDSSVMEISSLDVQAPAKKTTRAPKRKPQPQPEPEPDLDLEHSQVSEQIQNELESSFGLGAEAQSTPPVSKTKRGVKRTSDGARKKQDDVEEKVEATHVSVELPAPPKAKNTKGTKKKAVADESVISTSQTMEQSESNLDLEQPKQTKKKPGPKKGSKRKQASSTRTSRSSKATAASETDLSHHNEPEDLERDEREIEAELARMAAEQRAATSSQDHPSEYEPSPTHPHPQPTEDLTATVRSKPAARAPTAPTSPIPSASDKENLPSSLLSDHKPAASAYKHAAAPPTLQPTGLPLAPGTPNRNLSPRKLLSPAKQPLPHLTSTQPWAPVDLDALLASPAPASPDGLARRLADAGAGAGGLRSPEKGLSVEQWVRAQAERGEEVLRRRCEELVGRWEREGLRALGCLEGVEVVGA